LLASWEPAADAAPREAETLQEEPMMHQSDFRGAQPQTRRRFQAALLASAAAVELIRFDVVLEAAP
jgi:hypothetical protein